MELLVVTWAVRFALIGGVVAAVLSLMAGAQIVDAAIRSLIAALAFLLAARFLLDAMEPPEQKMARLRARRAKQAKKNGGKTPSKSDPAATRAVARSRTA